MEPEFVEKKFLERLTTYLKDQNLWGVQTSLLVACSGGPDSIALLRSLESLQKEGDFRLGVCTVDHQLRAVSKEEYEFVKELANKMGISFFGERIFVQALAEERRQSIETAARTERYRVLREVKEKEKFQYIATAHHIGDQVETVIAHLLRGTGPDGLTGMWPKRGDLVRPLLSFSKEDIYAYLDAIKQGFCVDESNSSNDYTRNRIRNQIVPILLEECPHLYDSISTLTGTMQRESLYWEKVLNELRHDLYEEKTCSWNQKGLRELDEAVRYRLYRQMAEPFLPTGATPTMAHLKAMDHVVMSEEHKEFSVKWMKFYGAYDRIYVVAPTQEERGYRMRFLEETDFFRPTDLGQVVLPKNMWDEGVYVRKRLAGDRIARLDKEAHIVGHRILKKYLMEQKIPKQEREQMWFLATKDSVLCVIDKNTCYAVRAEGNDYVRLQIEEEN